MNISKAIQRGDLRALRANEDEIVQDVNDMMKNPSVVWEDYITYWMAIYDDPEIATQMFEVFMNTCKTALKPQVYDKVLGLYSYPTMCGAIYSQNIEILEYIKSRVDSDTIMTEIEREFGIEDNEVYRWYQDNF